MDGKIPAAKNLIQDLFCVGRARTELNAGFLRVSLCPTEATYTHSHTFLDLYLGPQVLDHLELLTKCHAQRRCSLTIPFLTSAAKTKLHLELRLDPCFLLKLLTES